MEKYFQAIKEILDNKMHGLEKPRMGKIGSHRKGLRPRSEFANLPYTKLVITKNNSGCSWTAHSWFSKKLRRKN